MGIIQSALQNDGKLFSSESNAKLCEISSDDELKRITLTLESLPVEILIEILDFLPWKDLLNVTLVSKYFNTIISNNSKLFLNKIKFRYNQWNCKNIIWSGSRKYPNVKIYCWESKKLFSLKFDKTSVKVLSLDFDWNNFNKFRKFLLEFVNLEELCIVFVDFGKLQDCEILPLPKHTLRELTFSSVKSKAIDQLLKLFTDWQVNSLTIFSFVNFSENQNVFKFIMNQNSLEYLNLNTIYLGQLKDAKFKLKSLVVQYIDEDQNTFGKFLQNHQDSLTEFEIYGINDEIAEILNKFTKLKKLTVWKGGISEKLKLNTIESLELHECDCEGSFPFVKELYLKYNLLTTTGDMKYLHKLTIESIRLDEISIPTVKILSLITVYYPIRPFKFETSNLDELVIIRSTYFQGWLIEYLDRFETQLKKLKIVESLITPELVAAIERNCSKIKCFETVNCKEESNEKDQRELVSDFSTLKELFRNRKIY